MNANLLRGKMAEKGFSQEKLSSAIGISSMSLSRKMSGKRDFRLGEVAKICSVLEIDNVSEIFFDQNVPNTQR